MAPPPKPAESSTNKKKVTPAEVAFLVDRYLAENGFNAALAAFRSEAAHIYSPTKYSKKTPKRLIPLADILHDYIALKEARVAIESAMQAMQSLVSTYYASGSSSAAPPHMNMNMNMMMPPLPPPHAATGAQPSSPPLFFYAPNSSSPPSQGIIAIALQCPSPVWFFSALLLFCCRNRRPRLASRSSLRSRIRRGPCPQLLLRSVHSSSHLSAH
jgi:hypothetical protein